MDSVPGRSKISEQKNAEECTHFIFGRLYSLV